MSFGFRSHYDSKENQKRANTPSESDGRPAAGMKSKVLLCVPLSNLALRLSCCDQCPLAFGYQCLYGTSCTHSVVWVVDAGRRQSWAPQVRFQVHLQDSRRYILLYSCMFKLLYYVTLLHHSHLVTTNSPATLQRTSVQHKASMQYTLQPSCQ